MLAWLKKLFSKKEEDTIPLDIDPKDRVAYVLVGKDNRYIAFNEAPGLEPYGCSSLQHAQFLGYPEQARMYEYDSPDEDWDLYEVRLIRKVER